MRSEPGGRAVPPAVQRLRVGAVVVALWLLTFTQRSGLSAADTKLDLVVSPARFLARSLRMWDPTAASGQMQDQAYGYLFPMGPFFLLGKVAALPPWVVQRAWESLLLTAAFLGMLRVARALGVRGFLPPIAAALAYALAPRMLSELGVISSELLPAAVLPWVVLPLIRGSIEGSPRRAAALSGIAFACAGGINATAALAVLPVPAVWLLTRAAGRRRRSLALWWVVSIVLASLWWVVPLFVLGRYSPPFLTWIEPSSVTTAVTDLTDTLRGTDHWQGFLGPGEWPAAWVLIAAPAAVLATVAVAAMGVLGLARRSTPHRGFLICCLVVGIALVTLGHVASVGPPFAGTLRNLLDGPLAAFRNVHKFDPVVRFPIALGLGFAVRALAVRLPAAADRRIAGRHVTVFPRAMAVLAVVGIGAVAISPALAGNLIPRTRTVNEPTWWSATGSWLGAHEAQGRALVVPGAAQPTYIWGAPRDDALQPVADGPWAVRDAAPLARPGYTRMLDAVEAILAGGRSSAVLAPLLARAGVQYLVVRNDLDTSLSGSTPLRYVHATIAASPGWRQVAAFGPVTGPAVDANHLSDLGVTGGDQAVQVFDNASFTSGVGLVDASAAVAANGSSDALPALLAAGLDPGTPVAFGSDAQVLRRAGVALPTVLDDGIRRREFGFGGVDRYSATMTTKDAFAVERRTHDYLPDGAGGLSTASYRGVADVRASSSAAAIGPLFRSAADGPWAAFDGDPQTAWTSAAFTAVGQWLEVDLPQPERLGSVTVTFAAGLGALPVRVRLTTDAGSIQDVVAPASVPQTLAVPPGPTQSVRLTVEAVADGTRGTRVGISALTLPGVVPQRTLTVPASSTPDVMTFAVATGYRSACLSAPGGAPACDPTWAASGEEDGALDRTVTLSASAVYRWTAGVRLVPGPQLDALLDRGNPLRAIASSTDSTDPRERPGAAVDGDPTTGWVAEAGDRSPTLTVTLPRPTVLSGVRLVPISAAPTTVPTSVLVHAGRRVFQAAVDADGSVRFPARVRVSTVSFTVAASTLRLSIDSSTGVARQLPVGIGEVQFVGPHVPVGRGARAVDLGCSTPSPVTVDGTTVPVSVHGSSAAALSGATVTARPCDSAVLPLSAGTHELRVAANGVLAPDSLTMVRVGTTLPTAGTDGAATVRSWTATSRSVEVTAPRTSLLVVHENASAAWRATLDGRPLRSVTLDGWQQAWIVPAGSAGLVHLTFGPQRTVDLAFVAGAAALLLLLALAAARPRRTQAVPPVGDARLRRPVLSVAAVAALAVVGGAAGAALAVVVLMAMSTVDRAGRRWPAWLPAVPLAIAGVLEAARPWGSGHPLGDSAGAQLCCLLALALLVVDGARRAAPGSARVSQQRSLDEVPRRRRGSGRSGGRHGVERPEVTGERLPAEPALEGEQ